LLKRFTLCQKALKSDILAKIQHNLIFIVSKKKCSPDDSDLFRSSIGPVKSIKTGNIYTPEPEKPAPRPQKKAPEPIVIEARPDNGNDLAILYQEDIVSYAASGLQHSILKKLRKGYFSAEASIDLHGLTRQEAQRQLNLFIQNACENGYRCVHIIHGKGHRSPDQQPVLKNEINLWLRQHPQILCFCSASPRHGGTGALYVLLKLPEKYGDEEDTEY
jgi:DNA-nicking Smr family endonuclease